MTLKEANLGLTEQAYHELPELSYSVLSRYDREGYGCLEALDEKLSTPSLTFGSMVDCLLTQGQEMFDNFYVQAELPSLSENLQTIASLLLDNREESMMVMIPDDVILDMANMVGFYKSYKDATRVTKIREGLSVYYDSMRKYTGKTVVDSDMYQDALHCAEVLKTHPLTSVYFNQSPFSEIEIIFQLQLSSRYEGIPFKGMLDLVFIDHQNKVIYPCDLKTTKDIYSFEESFYKYRYYIQAAMYTQLLKDVIRKQCPELQDYTINPYRFIVIDRKRFRPVIFEWNPNNAEITAPDGTVRKSWSQLLTEVSWALKNRETQLPLDWAMQIRANGVVLLN